MAEKEATKEVKVKNNFTEFIGNNLGNLIGGIERERVPWISGILAAGGTALSLNNAAALALLGPLALPGIAPVAIAALIAGVGAGALSYVFDKRHSFLQSSMPDAS